MFWDTTMLFPTKKGFERESSASIYILDTRSAFLSLTHASPAGHADCIPVLVLPWPVVFLIQSRSWSEILLLVRWHAAYHTYIPGRISGVFSSWPPREAAVWTVGPGHEQTKQARPFNEAIAMQHLSFIRDHIHAETEEDRMCLDCSRDNSRFQSGT